MTWEIVAGLITLILFLITEGGIIFKLSAILTKLQASIEALNRILDELKSDNAVEHQKFNDMLFNHEGRLHDLETKCG